MNRQTHKLIPGSVQKQQGAALIVSMVLIFLLSILGLTSMRSSTIENRLVGNSLEKDVTFQAADSASELILAVESNLIDVVCTDQPVNTELQEISHDGQLQTSASVAYGGQAPAVGYSLDSNVASYRFTATVTATLTDSGTSTAVTQGVLILGARSSNGNC